MATMTKTALWERVGSDPVDHVEHPVAMADIEQLGWHEATVRAFRAAYPGREVGSDLFQWRLVSVT